jgi:UDP-galactopyranose mutase
MLKSKASRDTTRRLITDAALPSLLCFSHLRWDFVYQRPQHLMSRFAQRRRVYYVVEPTFDSGPATYELSAREHGLHVVVPRLPHGLSETERDARLRHVVDELMTSEGITDFVAWYYTPMALPWTRHLEAETVVYDCMDELSLFRGAPREIVDRERELIAMADVVFAGGASLYEAKRHRSSNVHCLPSSIDASHFRRARTFEGDPADQAEIPHIRLGFAGVIDERMDIDLLDGLAAARPDWHLVLLGPVVKIDPAQLPRRANIHYLGSKPYAELPAYLSGWDIALLPFALNEATRYISPTKMPEYLAAGCPVVSTPIRDVVNPYGIAELAHIGSEVEDFIAAIEDEIDRPEDARRRWLTRVDGFLSTMSWDRTHRQMAALISRAKADDADVRASAIGSARQAMSAGTRFDLALEA